MSKVYVVSVIVGIALVVAGITLHYYTSNNLASCLLGVVGSLTLLISDYVEVGKRWK